MKLRGMYKWMPVLAISLGLLAGCGKPKQYQKLESAATAVAGAYTKPKIDIVIFQDKSDSMQLPLQYIRPQLANFLAGIDSRWDYHFTVLPLQAVKPMSQKFIVAEDCVGLSNCIPAANSSSFNNLPGDWGWINSLDSSIGNSDYGLRNIRDNLKYSDMTSSGFLRSDAALASIVVSDGNDISTVRYTTNAGGQTVIDGPATEANLNGYIAELKFLKASSLMSKFYSVIAPGQANGLVNCYGSQVFAGSNYMAVSDALGSFYYDVCSGSSLSGVLGNIASQLQALVEAYVFSYVVLSDNPDQSTIKVYKNGVLVPKNNTNGWSIGSPFYRTNSPTAFVPAASNNQTGYFIQLNGTAQYKGSDKIKVTYTAL